MHLSNEDKLNRNRITGCTQDVLENCICIYERRIKPHLNEKIE